MGEQQGPAFDRRDQLEQIQNGLIQGERLYAVYDAKGAGTGFIGVTDRRVVIQDRSFVGKKTALVSLPYSRISSVAVVSDKSFAGSFFGTTSIGITSSDGRYHEVDFRGTDKARHVHDLILWHITAA
jgi:Bacterial PH domain